MKNKFTLDVDYIIKEMNPLIRGVNKNTNNLHEETIFLRSEQNKINIEKRGRKEEQILMNVKTFKKFCMKADTKRSETILDYYVNLEECNQEFTEYSLQETQKLLKEKDEKIKSLENQPSYYPVPKDQFCYVLQENTQLGTNIYKFGMTKFLNERKKPYKTAQSLGVKEVFTFKTNNCALVEKVVKNIIDNYKFGALQGGTEFYDIKLEYLINVIKVSGTFIDTLYGTKDNITKPDLIKHINNNLIKNLYGSEEYIKTFLPETILNSCQDIFNENHKNIKKKLKKHLSKNEINDISDNMCDDFNKAVNNILPEYDDFDLDELLSINEPKKLIQELN